MRSYTLISVLIASLAATPLSPPFVQNSGSVESPGIGSDNIQVAADLNRKREAKPANSDSNTVFNNQFPESQSPPTNVKNNVDTQAPANAFGSQAPMLQVPPTSINSGVDTQTPPNAFGGQVPKPQAPSTSGNSGVNTENSANVFANQVPESQAPTTGGMSKVDSSAEKLVTLQQKITKLYEEYMNEVVKSYGANAENMPKPSSYEGINTAQSSNLGTSEDVLDGNLNEERGEDEESPVNDSFNFGNFGPTESINQDKTENSPSNIPSTNNRLSPTSDSKIEGLNNPITGKNANKVNDKPQSPEQPSSNSPTSNQSSNSNQTPSEKVEIQSNRPNKVMLAEGPHGLY